MSTVKVLKPIFNLCNSITLGIELPGDNVSITKQAEKLDIKTMLQRAEMGILDLNQFRTPHDGDMHCPDVETPEQFEKELKPLLDSPDSVLNKQFGASREDAFAELCHHSLIAESHRTFVQKNEKEDVNYNKDDAE